MEWLFTLLAVFIWMALGAAIVLCVWWRIERRWKDGATVYAPYAELLGKACWIEDKHTGNREKFRIVAVSHKGAINVRRWDDESGHGAFWISNSKVAERVKFEGVRLDA